MKKLLIVGIYIISNNLFSQNYLEYYKIINEAELSVIDQNFIKSDSLYSIAFTLVNNPFKEDLFLAALNAGRLDKNKSVNSYLRRASEKGLNFKRINKRFKFYKKSKFWKQFKKDYKIIKAQYIDNINFSLYEKICSMVENDQSSRNSIFGSGKKSRKIDNYNYNYLLNIIKRLNKWPGFSVIGENTPKGKYDVSGNIALMLLHFKKEQIEALKPYMLRAVLDGEMYPYHYARIIDYTSSKITVSKDSLTGKQTINQCYKFGTYLNEAICNCETAEKERKKIGFEPIKDYYRKRKSYYFCNKN